MALKHNPRADRRRRLMVGALDSAAEVAGGRSSRSAARQDAMPDELTRRRQSGYSQDVRRAFRWRLVQWLPVSAVAFLSVIVVALALVSSLLATHWAIYVSGRWPWYGHPLAVLLDISHPRSVATWVQHQLWLLCLVTTVFIFQIRRYKLDDYRGEYRVWWWIIAGCGLASLNSSTHWVDLVGQSLDGWARTELGWSGSALVQAALYVAWGMATMRICTELKRTPLALAGWLLGMAALATSAALAQEELRLAWSLQWRVWLRYGSWLVGQCVLWLALVSYLRTIFLAAQQRFAVNPTTATARTGRWQRFPFRLGSTQSAASADRPPRRRRAEKVDAVESAESDSSSERPRVSRWRKWIRPPRTPADAPEFRKAKRAAPATEGFHDTSGDVPPRTRKQRDKSTSAPDSQSSESSDNQRDHRNEGDPVARTPREGVVRRAVGRVRSWRFPRWGRLPRPSLRGLVGRVRLPSLRLRPPRDRQGDGEQESTSGPRPVQRDREDRPSTSPPPPGRSSSGGGGLSDEELLGGQHKRPLTKAERKRLRRLQREHRNRAA